MQSKIGIIYFSGTGNTEFVAKSMKSKLEQMGEQADLINIEKNEAVSNDYKALIIGAPVYIDRYPEILIKYVKNNLKDYKNKCMLFTTQAADKEMTVYQHFIDKVPNLNVEYCMYVAMPNNVYNFFFKMATQDEKNKMINESSNTIEKGLSDFLSGKKLLYPKKKSSVFVTDLVYKMVYPYFIKFINKKITLDKDKCTGCKLCEKSCPVNCIKIQDGVSFNKDCTFCQRCINICPNNAFLYKNKEINQYKLGLKELEDVK